MASFIEKVQTLISANLHAMVDKALESNSVAVMDQYIRDAEDNLEKLEDAVATVGGNVRTLERKWKKHQAEADKLDRSIDTLLLHKKMDLAAAAQTRLNNSRRIAADYQVQWQEQGQQYEQLRDARRKLETRLTTIRQEREHLLALLELAKSKEVAVKAVKSLDDLTGVGDADIARIGESIRARLDRATARGEMYTGRLEDQMDEALEKSEIDIQLEERMRRLGMEAGG